MRQSSTSAHTVPETTTSDPPPTTGPGTSAARDRGPFVCPATDAGSARSAKCDPATLARGRSGVP